MNRNEVLEAMAKAIWNSWIIDKLCQSELKDILWEELVSFGEDNDTIQLVVVSVRSQAEAALSALEAIMEREGLKMLASDSYPENAAGLDKVMYRAHFDQAKCKLKGGDDV